MENKKESFEKQSNQSFQPNEKYLNPDNLKEMIAQRISEPDKVTPYYPLPSNENYEKFLQKMKKNQYQKTQYSIPFLLSLKKKYEEKPQNMTEIKIPLKHEIRSRAKILTDEAFRETRNYLDVQAETKNANNKDLNNLYKKTITKTPREIADKTYSDMIFVKTNELREALNKISCENYHTYLEHILKTNYDESLLENLKELLFSKVVTEKNFSEIYMNIAVELFKLYNKRNYPNNPNMNFKSLMLKKSQEEFYSKETNIAFPFVFDEIEREKRVVDIKIGNIKLIGDFYLRGIIQHKILKDIIDALLKANDDFNIRLTCELVKKISSKLFIEDFSLLEKVISKLEQHYDNDKNISTKIKFMILDVMDLKKSNYGVKEYDLLKKDTNYEFNPTPRKNSYLSNFGSRKSSINPSNVDYIRRSRFNSKADELMTKNKEVSLNPNLMDEVLKELGSDIDFYHCFKLTEEEFDIIKEHNNHYISIEHQLTTQEIKQNFLLLLENVPCEKFIAIGHLIENFFSQNTKDSEVTMNYVIKLLENNIIEVDDLRHGIVLGMVNFAENIIDYPNSKEYFRKFLSMTKARNVMDSNLLTVFERCCENMIR